MSEVVAEFEQASTKAGAPGRGVSPPKAAKGRKRTQRWLRFRSLPPLRGYAGARLEAS